MLPTFNVPPIGPRQAKVWGDTQLLFAWCGTECHLIRFKKGGFCSKHRHEHKWNRFVVLKGKLIVRIFRDGGTVDETIIDRGQLSDVPPGVWHQFEVPEDGEALEFYWVELQAGDIERESEGGKRNDS